MKKLFLLIAAAALIMSGCSSDKPDAAAVTTADYTIAEISADTAAEIETTTAEVKQSKSPDVDLTLLSSTMVYSELYNILSYPDDYVGKTIKMSGTFEVYPNPELGIDYYVLMVYDNTACCQLGMEFILADENYPEAGGDLTVMGEFETYIEGEYLYCHLINAELV